MSVPTREEVEQRVLRDVRPDVCIMIQRAVERYRKYRPELECVTTMQGLIVELERVIVIFYGNYAEADKSADVSRRDRWHREWSYLLTYITQLRSMYLENY